MGCNTLMALSNCLVLNSSKALFIFVSVFNIYILYAAKLNVFISQYSLFQFLKLVSFGLLYSFYSDL